MKGTQAGSGVFLESVVRGRRPRESVLAGRSSAAVEAWAKCLLGYFPLSGVVPTERTAAVAEPCSLLLALGPSAKKTRYQAALLPIF